MTLKHLNNPFKCDTHHTQTENFKYFGFDTQNYGVDSGFLIWLIGYGYFWTPVSIMASLPFRNWNCCFPSALLITWYSRAHIPRYPKSTHSYRKWQCISICFILLWNTEFVFFNNVKCSLIVTKKFHRFVKKNTHSH